jgi:hypothetical protein
MALEYCRFFREQLEAKELEISQAPEFIKSQTGYEITVTQAYEFLDSKRDSTPNSAMTKVWERAFKVNLSPAYYGADKAFPKSEGKRR